MQASGIVLGGGDMVTYSDILCYYLLWNDLLNSKVPVLNSYFT